MSWDVYSFTFTNLLLGCSDVNDASIELHVDRRDFGEVDYECEYVVRGAAEADEVGVDK